MTAAVLLFIFPFMCHFTGEFHFIIIMNILSNSKGLVFNKLHTKKKLKQLLTRMYKEVHSVQMSNALLMVMSFR